jgi:hypothetical protein
MKNADPRKKEEGYVQYAAHDGEALGWHGLRLVTKGRRITCTACELGDRSSGRSSYLVSSSYQSFTSANRPWA